MLCVNDALITPQLATNYELVKHVVDIAKVMGREIATPAEAREILSMPAGASCTTTTSGGMWHAPRLSLNRA